jgi:hypothetical protein
MSETAFGKGRSTPVTGLARRRRIPLLWPIANTDTAAIEKVWLECAQMSEKISQAEFDDRHIAFLRDLVCTAPRTDRTAIADGVARNWISDSEDRRDFSSRLARGLLEEDGKKCPATKDIREETKELLRTFAPPE